MGAAWCKDRAEKARDSKSPLDRVIVKCVNQMSLAERPLPAPAVVKGPPKHPRLHLQAAPAPAPTPEPKPRAAPGWQEAVLSVPPPEGRPVPPPRKKRLPRSTAEAVERPPAVVAAAPAIFVEVDTPSAKPRSRPAAAAPAAAAAAPAEGKRPSAGSLLGLPVSRSRSSLSLRSASPVSEATAERLENYMKSCRSFGSLRPEDLLDEISQALSDTGSEDSWDEWEAPPAGGSPPLTPTSQLAAKSSPTRPRFLVGDPATSPDQPQAQTKTKAKKKKKRKGKKEPGEAVSPPPANFQAGPASHEQGEGVGAIIRPSHIPVQDFLRRSGGGSSDGDPRPPEPTLGVAGDSLSFSFDFSRGLMPPKSPQIEIPGTPCSPHGLSRCASPMPFPSPSPEEPLPPWSADEDDTTANLLNIMQEYQYTAGVLGDGDAKKILREAGIPESLLDELPNIHEVGKVAPEKHHGAEVAGRKVEEQQGSGMSSMTPSLTELEASLSELLEASAVNDDEEFEELQSQGSALSAGSGVREAPPQEEKPVQAGGACPERPKTQSTEESASKAARTEPSKRTSGLQKERMLAAVISQEVPKILLPQSEDTAETEDSAQKPKEDGDVKKTGVQKAEEEKPANVITVACAV